MKKNVIIIILIVAVIALLVSVFILIQNKDKNVNTNANTQTNNSNTENNTNKKADETQNKQEVNNNTSNTTAPTINTTANTKIYIVRGTNTETVGVNVDDSLSTIDKAKSLINEIGNAIGYKIVINTITSGKGGMSVDFNKASAPFDVSTTYIGNGNEKYHLLSVDDTASTIFDSIKDTLQNYFGKTMDVYYSMDDKDINMENIGIKISRLEPYNKK